MIDFLRSLTDRQWMEIICAVILLYGLVKGWMNGLIKELCSTLGFVVGCVVAHYCYTRYGLGLGWTLLVCITFPIALGIVSSLLSAVLERIFVVGTLNKLLGALVGCVKYALLIGFVLYVIENVEEWKNLLII